MFSLCLASPPTDTISSWLSNFLKVRGEVGADLWIETQLLISYSFQNTAFFGQPPWGQSTVESLFVVINQTPSEESCLDTISNKHFPHFVFLNEPITLWPPSSIIRKSRWEPGVLNALPITTQLRSARSGIWTKILVILTPGSSANIQCEFGLTTSLIWTAYVTTCKGWFQLFAVRAPWGSLSCLVTSSFPSIPPKPLVFQPTFDSPLLVAMETNTYPTIITPFRNWFSSIPSSASLKQLLFKMDIWVCVRVL